MFPVGFTGQTQHELDDVLDDVLDDDGAGTTKEVVNGNAGINGNAGNNGRGTGG